MYWMNIWLFNSHLSRNFVAYRTINFQNNASNSLLVLLTDLLVDHHIVVVGQDNFKYQSPILKKDLYAGLVKLIGRVDLPDDFKWEYVDMDMYHDYRILFQENVFVLPQPYLKRFYPDSYVTRQDFINLLMILVGSGEQLATTSNGRAHINCA